MVARKVSSLPTRIWSFGARVEPEPENIERTWLLMRRSNDYYNGLLEAHKQHVERYRQLREEHVPELSTLRAEVERTIEGAKVAMERAKRLRKSRAPAAEQALAKQEKEAALAAKKAAVAAEREVRQAVEGSLTQAREELAARIAARCGPSTARTVGPRIVAKVTAEERSAMRDEGEWPPLWVALDAEDERYLTERKMLRAVSGLPYGCYLLAEGALQQAISSARPLLPQRRSLSRATRIGVQLTGTVTWKDVIAGACGRFRVEPGVPQEGRTVGRGARQERRVGIRVEANPNVYVWATIRLHREPHPDAIIKWAWLRLQRTGGRLRAEVQLTLEHQSLSVPRRPVGTGTVAVTPCCLIGEQGIIVAQWEGDDGEKGDITVTHAAIAKLTYQEGWSSALDSAHAAALHVLDPGAKALSFPARRGLERLMAAWCRERFGDEQLDRWWKEWVRDRKAENRQLLDRPDAADTLGTWWPKDTFRWMAQRRQNPEDALAWWAWTWVKQMWHLNDGRASVRRRSIAQRDQRFRHDAIRLSTRYEFAIVDKPRIAPKKRHRSERDQHTNAVLHLMGVAVFRSHLMEVFGARAKDRALDTLSTDLGAALNEVVTRAAQSAGQKRRGHRRRPECERSPAAKTSGGARTSNGGAGSGPLNEQPGG